MAERPPIRSERNAQIEVWVEEEDGLIAGLLCDDGDEPRGFSGWTELFMVLERWRAAEPWRPAGETEG